MTTSIEPHRRARLCHAQQTLTWLLATVLGCLAGGLLLAGLAAGINCFVVRPEIFGVVYVYLLVEAKRILLSAGTIASALFGALVGVAQWLVLRHRLRGAAWWILATAVGMPLGLLTSLAVTGYILTPIARARVEPFIISFVSGERALTLGLPWWLSWVACGLVAGAVIGLMQWLVLRRSVPRAGWWILAHAVSLASGVITALLVMEGRFTPQPILTAALIGVIVYGGLTGLALVLLVFRKDISPSPQLILVENHLSE